MATGAEATVRAYYDALEAGDALAPFFADGETTVKFGISETLRGGQAVAEGLSTQSATTTDWQVDSHGLLVGQREGWAWFADEVSLAWTDTERRVRYEFDTRWSGSLEREDGDWQFVAMHVSRAGDL